jgi:hypothetical protein
MGTLSRTSDIARLREKLPRLWAIPDLTCRAIGERFGVSGRTVQKVARELGLGDKPKLRMQRQVQLPRGRQGWTLDP